MADQEINTIIANITSLLDQLKQMAGGGVGPEVPPEMAPPPAEGEEDLQKILKYLKDMDKDEDDKEEGFNPKEIEKSSEGTTNDDNADARIKDQPKENLDAIREVAKQLALIMSKKQTVAKSTSVNATANGLYEITKMLVDEVKELKKAQENILTGLGVADEILKTSEIKKSLDVPRKLENDPSEIQKTLDEIKNQLSVSKEQEKNTNGNSHYLAKALSEKDGMALNMIFSGRKK